MTRRLTLVLVAVVVTTLLLSGAGTPLAGRLQMLDARAMEWNEVRIPRNSACPVCGTRPAPAPPPADTAAP